MIVGQHHFYLVEGLGVGNELILGIDDLHIVFVETFLVLLVPLLEDNDDEVVVLILSDDLLDSLHVVDLHLLARPVLVDVLVISLEADEDVAVLHDLHEFHLVLDDPLPLTKVFQPEKVLLVRIVQVGLVLSASQFNLPYLLLVKHLIGEFVVVLQDVL